MDTILAQSGNRRRQRRSYTEEDKEHLIAICNQPGVSTAFVARQHDINANLLHRWVREREKLNEPPVKSPQLDEKGKPLFVALAVPPRSALDSYASVVKIEIRRGETVVTLECPVSQIALSTSLIKELMT